jgi:hypothetical protein
MNISVESCGGIAFASGIKSLKKGRQGRMAMPRRASMVSPWRAVLPGIWAKTAFLLPRAALL